MATSFSTDIAPMFAPFQSNMMWRFDLANYAAVKANAEMIYDRLTGNAQPAMPPPPMPPLDPSLIQLFKQWMDEGCPA